MNKHLAILVIALISLASCNKNDVIPPEDPYMPQGFRPATSQSSPYQSMVYEYLPAPGQFVNDPQSGFNEDITSMDDAVSYAERRLAAQQYVSLGAYGGYIIVGFDHSIANSKGNYDFAILGNAMEQSNEPGAVWVMTDTNGNGQPDDTWYELRGSEYGQATTIQNYSVTYHRPSAPQMPVQWTDSEGNSGTVDYLIAFHKQDYYYPTWVKTDSYILTGTRLEARNSKDEASGNWVNAPYGWGYADNCGSDVVKGHEKWVGFKIANAMKTDGTPANLQYIDFVKVQQAVMAKSGWLGENSCEVLSFADYNMIFK